MTFVKFIIAHGHHALHVRELMRHSPTFHRQADIDRPERSLPHRAPTRIIILFYKWTGLSIYSKTFKHNYYKIRHYADFCVPLRTFADLIPVRGRSPWLPFAILLGSVSILGRAGVVSNRSALCPSTSVWAFLEVSSLLLNALQRSCILFSSHGPTTKVISVWHMWWLAWPLHRSWTFHFWFGLCLFCPESILTCSSRLCASFAALLCVAPNTHCHISKSVWLQFCTVCSSASPGPSYRRLPQITFSKSSTLFVLCYRHLLHILRLLLLLIPSTWMSWCMVLVLLLSKLLHLILLVSSIRSSFY